jgi:hypothetical protein
MMIVENADDQFRYRLVGTAVVQAIGHDATGSAVGSYLVEPAQAMEARAIFERAFTNANPIFASGEFIFESGASFAMSLLTLPLSGDGTVVNMTVSTLVTGYSALRRKQGWLRGLPVKVWNVIDVKSAAKLRKLCLDWEQRCDPAS